VEFGRLGLQSRETDVRKLQTPQTFRDQRRSCALTKTDKEFPPSEIASRPPLCPAQSSVSSRITCMANLTSVLDVVKVGRGGAAVRLL
jgi:hypothetical protein